MAFRAIFLQGNGRSSRVTGSQSQCRIKFIDTFAFFQLEDLVSHLGMSPGDIFLPQSEHSLEEIPKVRPMPQLNTLAQKLTH